MKVKFINHSCFVVSHGAVRLLIDPWLDGRIFEDGWALVSKTPFRNEDFEEITHIWISHEHPDHFHPPSLARIPPSLRSRMTLLYHLDPDKRMIEAFRKLGFGNVIEMQPNSWLDLGDSIEALCERYSLADSWLALRADGKTILNTNDCGFHQADLADEIAARLGPIDAQFQQFSYANWAGNPDQVEFRRNRAMKSLRCVEFICKHFKPREMVLIASYSWFCHRENKHLNDSVISPRCAMKFVEENTSSLPVVLYPGDDYTPGVPHDSESSTRRHEADFALVMEAVSRGENLSESAPVAAADLFASAAEFLKDLSRNKWARWLLRRPVTVFIWDHNQAYSLSVDALTPVALAERQCQFAMSAESLQNCFLKPWGWGNLGISGRFHNYRGADHTALANFFRFRHLESHNTKIGLRYLSGVAFRKVKWRLGIGRQFN